MNQTTNASMIELSNDELAQVQGGDGDYNVGEVVWMDGGMYQYKEEGGGWESVNDQAMP